MAASQPFEGIKVVEFGQFVAVPFCGQLLAEGGAEVIKVESPEGDPNRHMGEVVAFESRIFILSESWQAYPTAKAQRCQRQTGH